MAGLAFGRAVLFLLLTWDGVIFLLFGSAPKKREREKKPCHLRTPCGAKGISNWSLILNTVTLVDDLLRAFFRRSLFAHASSSSSSSVYSRAKF